MKRNSLLLVTFICLNILTTRAQFNTINRQGNRYKICSTNGLEKSLCHVDSIDSLIVRNHRGNRDSLKWVREYLSVSYPLRTIKVTSPFGYRSDPFSGKKRMHSGIDLRANSDLVFSMMPGEVIKVGEDPTSGLYVILKHGDIQVSYCHLSRILVSIGMILRAGDSIGVTGNTGRSTGEHLHLACKDKSGKYVDPSHLLIYIKKIRDESILQLASLTYY